MGKDHRSDRELLALIRERDGAALQTLFRRYHDIMCRYAYGSVADKNTVEDAVVRVFERLWRKPRSLEVPPEDEGGIRSYLFTAARNEAVSLLRREIRHAEILDADSEDILLRTPQDTPDAPQRMESSELLRELEQLVATLPAQRQEVFRLSRFDGLKYKEIAKVMGISVRTVQNHMIIAMEQLRPHLEALRRS